MKNRLLIFVLFVFCFVSCDEKYYDTFIISNKCNDKINVIAKLNNGSDLNFDVKNQSDTVFFEMWWIGQKDYPITSKFKTILINKDSLVSKKDYLQKKYWRFIDEDKAHRKWFLTINPEDFETE